MRPRVFFPQERLDEWVAGDRVDFSGDELTLRGVGRRYRTVEAVRVVSEVTGSPDPHDLVGSVKSRAFLLELGAEMLEGSMVISDNAYDIVPGFIGSPVDDNPTGPSSETDEAVLSQFVSA